MTRASSLSFVRSSPGVFSCRIHRRCARIGRSEPHTEPRRRRRAHPLVEPIHEAILDIVGQDGFQLDTRLLARMLDSDTDTVNVAVQRLLRVGLLVMESTARFGVFRSRVDTAHADDI